MSARRAIRPYTGLKRKTSEMAGDAAAALLTIQAIQSIFKQFEDNIKPEGYLCPVNAPVENITSNSFNYIIVGGGTAGSVLANRLSACPNVSVLLLEAGGCPPYESNNVGLFGYIPRSDFDYDISAINNNHSLQNLQGNVGQLTIGKMLGGTSGLHHDIRITPDALSYQRWADAVNDSSWDFEHNLPYLKKTENVRDNAILEKYGSYHGTEGNIQVQRLPSSDNIFIKNAYSELGYKDRIDTNNNDPLGVAEPLLEYGDSMRQSALVSYISPVKDRSNLKVLTYATVTKIVMNDTRAVGVQFSYNGNSYVTYCIDEVIVSAGAILTPQILMLSGIGPADHLKSKNITVIADLPVGRNLQDHTSAIVSFNLGRDTSVSSYSNPAEFPAPMTCNFVNLDNSTANFSQCQGVNIIFPKNSSGLMALCLNVFKLKVSMCQQWYEANVENKIMFWFTASHNPESRGYILLNTTDINDHPLVYPGHLSVKNDQVNLGKCLANSAPLLNTTYFKDIGAEYIDFGFCADYEKFSSEYFECLALELSSLTWHFVGSASMGSVVDTQLFVKGLKGLRVADASVVPVIPDAKIISVIYALAERAADIILSSRESC